MTYNKKIIGMCITKVHDVGRSDYVSRLHSIAKEQGYKLIIFNSFEDFYKHDEFDIGAGAVYDVINYDMLDALVVHTRSFYNRELMESIIKKAHLRGIPVIVLDEEISGCSSIVASFESAFEKLIQHVVVDHGATDTYFVAGRRDDDPVSDARIACYKKVLEANSVPFEWSRVGYGDYWDEPTKKTVSEMLDSRETPPQAIICANDYMALATCQLLESRGIKVPDDVIVTGFDCVPAADHSYPSLTTCSDNIENLARLTVKAVTEATESGVTERVYKNPYRTRISESCGCASHTAHDYRNVAGELHHALAEIEVHEDFMYSWIDKMMDIKDIDHLYLTMSRRLLSGSCVCLRNDFVEAAGADTLDSNGTVLPDEMKAIYFIQKHENEIKSEQFCRNTMIPHFDKWVDDDSCCILNSVYVGSKVCGYYVVTTNNIMACKNMIKRVLKTINIAFNVAVNSFRQQHMQNSILAAGYRNHLTGLPNLKGAIQWFEHFGSEPKHREGPIAVSVYALPKYTYIYENYGIQDIENAILMVADLLKKANAEDSFVAQISEDSFMVLNYFENYDKVSDVIQHSTSTLFGGVEHFNQNSGKEYYVEVNAGCSVIGPGWDASLESYIKSANNELYMNRLKNGGGPAVKERSAATPKAHYKAFDLLVSNNLFTYHFQPIVSAKNGDIYAYEALMRTDTSIGMNPLEVLDAAKEFSRLYEIEKATMFNVMERYTQRPQDFGDKMLFINTIPGHFLNSTDTEQLVNKYGSKLDRVVFELTEQDTVSDAELDFIRSFGSAEQSRIAIDDYGTGHSNIVNLLRYNPHIIKIDRFLITDIHKNQNKQMFVRSTVEFAKLNGIKVLAEGVETYNEMRTVIDLGVDFIQGYYIGKPVAEPIPVIKEEVRREIIEANPLFGQEFDH